MERGLAGRLGFNKMRYGKVPMFKMKPQKELLWGAVFVLVLGIAFYFNGHSDPGNPSAEESGHLVLAVSIVIAGVMVVMSTAKMWFKHLWHDRYK